MSAPLTDCARNMRRISGCCSRWPAGGAVPRPGQWFTPTAEQYTSIRYSERIATAGITPSVGGVGSSYDNALAETINGLYKTEVIRRLGPWRGVDQVEHATLEWVDWYNNRRLFEY